jgi:hypothetical protein
MNKILDFNNFVLFENEITESKSNLFDIDNKLLYRTLKDVKTTTISGREYNFMCIGSGMKAYADSINETNKKIGSVLLKIADKKDKAIVFTPDGIYVVSEAVADGLMTLASSIFSYVKEGEITAGLSVIYTFSRINKYYTDKGEEYFNNMKEDPTSLFKMVIKDLYNLAEKSPKASEAVSVLTVGSYKSSTSAFKTIPEFLSSCVYATAKEIGIKSVNIGQNIEDFYKVSQNTLDNLKVPINKTIDDGMEKMTQMIDKGIRKGNVFGARLKKDTQDALKSVQDRIAPTGKAIATKSRNIWDSIAGKKRTN